MAARSLVQMLLASFAVGLMLGAGFTRTARHLGNAHAYVFGGDAAGGAAGGADGAAAALFAEPDAVETKAEVETKAAAIAERAGWEQALWDRLFTALGYKQNS